MLHLVYKGHKWNRQIDNQSDWRFAFSSHKLGSMLWHRGFNMRLDRQTKKLSPSAKPLKSLTILRGVFLTIFNQNLLKVCFFREI